MKNKSLLIISIPLSSLIAFGLPFLLYFNNTTLATNQFILYLILRTLTGLFAFYVVVGLIFTVLKHRNLFILAISGVMFLLAYVLETLSFFALNTTVDEYFLHSKIMFMISQYLITIAPLLLMIFVVSYFSNKPNILAYLPVVIDVLLETVYQPMEFNIGKVEVEINDKMVSHWVYQPMAFWITALYYFSIVWMVGYMFYLIWTSGKGTVDKRMEEQQRIFLTGMILVFIIAPVLYSANIFISNGSLRLLWISVIGRTFVVIGLSLFIISYTRSSQKLNFFKYQPLISLHIFDHKDMKLRTSHYFRKGSDKNVVKFLGKNLDDLNSIISEVVNIETSLGSIEMSDYIINMKSMKSKDLLCVLLVKYMTSAIEFRFNNLVTALDELPLHDVHNTYISEIINLNFGA